jgi:hypothetical protein
MDSKKQLLERVLLLMKYDNKQTYSENKKNVLIEQSMGGALLPQTQDNGMTASVHEMNKWKPKLKTYKSFWGENIDLPESSKIKYFNLTELKKNNSYPVDGGDEIGFYAYLDSLKSVNPTVYNMVYKNAQTKWAMEPEKLKNIGTIKFYYPSDKAMNSLFASNEIFQFTIPKGTMIPFDESVKENPDDWFSTRNQGERPLDKDIRFSPVSQLIPNFATKVLNGENDGMFNNWTYNTAYYTSDLDSGKLVSYVPELWIQYKSPTKLWWDKYGVWVELVGTVLITILSEGLLSPAAISVLGLEGALASNAGFILDLFFNGIFNLGIAKMHFNAHDDASGWMSMAFCFLPLLHKYGGAAIQKYFVGLNKEAVSLASKEVLETSRGLNISSKASIEKWFKGLSPTTQKVVQSYAKIPAKEIDTVAKQVLEIGNKLMKQARRANPQWLTKHIFTSIGKGLGKFAATMTVDLALLETSFKTIEAVNGKPFSPVEKLNIIIYVSGLANTPEEFDEALQQFSEDVKNGTVTTDELIQIADYQQLPQDTINSYIQTIDKNNPGFEEFID